MMSCARVSAMLAVVVATSVGAQDVGHFVARKGNIAGNLIAADMGRCLLDRDRSKAIAIVDLDPKSPGFKPLAEAIERSMIACLKGKPSATISSFYLRGAISEALLRERDAVLLQAAGHSEPTKPERVISSDASESAPAMIACAVGADPADAAEVIAAEAESPAEMGAFANMSPSLQACAPLNGAVKLRRPMVRPAIAIALYRIGRGTGNASSSSGAK